MLNPHPCLLYTSYAERREHAFKSAGLRSSAGGCLCICFRDKQFKTPTVRYGFTEGSENFRRPVLRSLKNFFCKSESCHGSLCLSKECKGQSGRAPPFLNFVFYFLSLKLSLQKSGNLIKNSVNSRSSLKLPEVISLFRGLCLLRTSCTRLRNCPDPRPHEFPS